MNCVIYLRVSTKEQAEKGYGDEGYSIPAQRKSCLSYIKDKGWNLVDEYIDRGESARTAARPQLQEMLLRVKDDKSINAVVIHKIDRLARNMEDHVAIRATLKKHDVGLVSITERIEETASGKLVENIFASFAEFYSSNLGAETRKGMAEKARQGGWPQFAPIGYENVKEVVAGKTISKIDIDKNRAPYIIQAFKMYSTGNYSLSQLQESLAETGLRSRPNRKLVSRPLSTSSLSRMLQNPFYTGTVRWKNLLVDGLHKPIISKGIFSKVQEVLKIHRLTDVRNRVFNHYLKGTIFCGECGSRLSIDTAKGIYTYFYCLGRKRRNGCKQKYISASDVEKAIEKLYKKINLSPEWAKKIKDKLEKELIEKQVTGTNEQLVLRKRLTTLTVEQTKLLHAYYADAIPINLLKKEQARVAEDIGKAEGRLEQLSSGNDQVNKMLDIALLMCLNSGYAYKKAKPAVRSNLNRAIFEKIHIQNKKIKQVNYTALFEFLFNPQRKMSKSSNSVSLAPRVGFEPTTFRLTAERSTG